MSENIESCPFCGERPSFKKDYADMYRFYHTCKYTKPQINIHSHGYKTRKQAIEAWNNRR